MHQGVIKSPLDAVRTRVAVRRGNSFFDGFVTKVETDAYGDGYVMGHLIIKPDEREQGTGFRVPIEDVKPSLTGAGAGGLKLKLK